MKQATQIYYKKLSPEVRTWYYSSEPDLKEPFELREPNWLVFRGEEHFVPGILEKTIRSFEFACQQPDWDYVIRSNVSTLVDFYQLKKELQEDFRRNGPLFYAGANILTLAWIDEGSGIKDDRYFGTVYAQGTSIIFSKVAIQNIVTHQSDLQMDVIDDVALGLLFHKLYPYKTVRFIGYQNQNPNLNIVELPYSFHRHKSANRQEDVRVITERCQLLQEMNRST